MFWFSHYANGCDNIGVLQAAHGDCGLHEGDPILLGAQTDRCHLLRLLLGSMPQGLVHTPKEATPNFKEHPNTYTILHLLHMHAEKHVNPLLLHV